MSCVSALHSQLQTILSAPRQVLLLEHKVFREYAKTAVGPDFVHTLPSFIILTALAFFLWKHPPSNKWLLDAVGSPLSYRIIQLSISWLVIDVALWCWLIFQRMLYCGIWTSWSYESEYSKVPHQWWQRVWSSYYPLPMEPPVLSSSFISWIISMILAMTALGCAVSATKGRLCFAETFFCQVLYQVRLSMAQHCMQWIALSSEKVTRDTKEEGLSIGTDVSSAHDECPFEEPNDVCARQRFEIRSISNGTNWTPRPNFSSGRKEALRKTSIKSVQTVAGVNDAQDDEKLPPRQMWLRRQCSSQIPCNSSDKSSGR